MDHNTLFDGTPLGTRSASNAPILEQAIDLIDKLMRFEILSVTFTDRYGRPIIHASNIMTVGGFKSVINEIDYLGRKGGGIYLDPSIGMTAEKFQDLWFSRIEKIYGFYASGDEDCHFKVTM